MDETPKTTIPCACWERTETELREKGYEFIKSCSALVWGEKELEVRRYLPLQRTDGKRLKRSDPQGMTLSFCPFCGQAF